MSILVVHTQKCRDVAINFARECALEVIRSIRTKRPETKIIKGSNIDRRHVFNVLLTSVDQHGAFLGFGHGDIDYLADSRRRCIFHKDDAEVLRNKICYVLACNTFKGLGAEAINKGASAYIGFSDVFLVPTLYRNLMINCCTAGIVKFLLGDCTLDEIRIITIAEFHNAIKTLNSNQFKDTRRDALTSKLTFASNANSLGFATGGSGGLHFSSD